MANVFNVARFILGNEGRMSTWKLQKLCYYSQAWSLAWTEEPLFEEDFEAWANGPVCPILFHQHKGKYFVSQDDFSAMLESSDALTPDQCDTIERVVAHYGEYEPFELREQTHSERPWIIARGDTAAGEPSSAIITKDSMGVYYGSL